MRSPGKANAKCLLDAKLFQGEKSLEERLRPQRFSDFFGQTKIKTQLEIYLKATKSRKEVLDHTLLYGPPGLGKTTLAGVIAGELGVNVKVTSGAAIERSIDLLVILKSLQPKEVLFIDEIHRVRRPLEEVLYPAMEDFIFHRVIQKGLSTAATTIRISPFTLIGATTRPGLISSPLRDRFGIIFRLHFYAPDELKKILFRSSQIFKVQVDEPALQEIATRSRGTPRIANRLLRRVRDFATVQGLDCITLEVAREALNALSVDLFGLDEVDRRYLDLLINKFGGGPVGLETLAGSLGEDPETLEQMCEPYLLQQGFLQRTPRGRAATPASRHHMRRNRLTFAI